MDDYKKYDNYSYFCGLALLALFAILLALFISSGDGNTTTLIKITSALMVFDSLVWLFLRAFIYKPLIFQVIALTFTVINLICQVF